MGSNGGIALAVSDGADYYFLWLAFAETDLGSTIVKLFRFT